VARACTLCAWRASSAHKPNNAELHGYTAAARATALEIARQGAFGVRTASGAVISMVLAYINVLTPFAGHPTRSGGRNISFAISPRHHLHATSHLPAFFRAPCLHSRRAYFSGRGCYRKT